MLKIKIFNDINKVTNYVYYSINKYHHDIYYNYENKNFLIVSGQIWDIDEFLNIFPVSIDECFKFLCSTKELCEKYKWIKNDESNAPFIFVNYYLPANFDNFILKEINNQ